MRMRDVVRQTGLSSATVHFYVNSGLVPPPAKPTRNSAVYDEDQVKRLNLIRRLRTEGGGMPLASIRRVLELVDQGVEPEVAVALTRAVLGGAAGTGAKAGKGAANRRELASLSGLSPTLLKSLLDARVLVPAPGSDPAFDATDVRIARMLKKMFDMLEVSPEELGEIAALIEEASAREVEIRNRAARKLDAAGAARLSGQVQEAANFWHAYLFARARQTEILEHGLGVIDRAGQKDGGEP